MRLSVRQMLPVHMGAVVIAVAAALLVMPGFTDAASASPCSRWGDTKPRQLTMKHARNAVICLINKARDENGRRRDLRLDNRLQEAARKHSNRMASRSCFSHQCRGEAGTLERLRKSGYIHGGLSRWGYGENIFWGRRASGTPRQAVRAWMGSPPHRANILSGSFRDIGAGFAHNGSRAYYTADFGYRSG
jgi:uncharacterized protein YkwD